MYNELKTYTMKFEHIQGFEKKKPILAIFIRKNFPMFSALGFARCEYFVIRQVMVPGCGRDDCVPFTVAAVLLYTFAP